MTETLPGVDDGPGERVIVHVDIDCFYASCERLREPQLIDEPVVVGMGYEPGERHGAVATASYEARAYGVDSAQPIEEALDRLPRVADADRTDPEAPDPTEAGHYRPVDMEYYESVAERVKGVLHDLADTVREVSVDEAYLDATDATSWAPVGEGAVAEGDGSDVDTDEDADTNEHTDEDVDSERRLAAGYARHVRQEIRRRVGVPASVGVAPNMAVAKVASDHDKPDGLTVVAPERVRSFLAPLPAEDLHGVGPVRASELAAMGIETAGELASADADRLVERFGDRGRELYDRARGRDDREVTPRGRPKSLSRESAFTEATDDPAAKREKVRALAADVSERARSRGATYRTIGIKAVQPPFDVNTRAESLSGPVDDPDLVREVALELLTEFETVPVRKLGVRVSNLSFGGGDQAKLGGYDGDTAGVSNGGGTAAGDGGDAHDVVGAGGATLEEWAETATGTDSAADGEAVYADGDTPQTLTAWAERGGTAWDESDAAAWDEPDDTDAESDRRCRGPAQPSLDAFEPTGGDGDE
ncbi:DNA polymerase IV [Halobaculum sp. MBLA0143]|uniref:DNA polymerase Y family protein n=1 Tax=Halobaculum sp. MBLA0143 TaxID=3079933 RepID=UPI003525D9F5